MKRFNLIYRNLKTYEKKVIGVYKKKGWLLRKLIKIVEENPEKWELEYDFFKNKYVARPKNKNECYDVVIENLLFDK